MRIGRVYQREWHFWPTRAWARCCLSFCVLTPTFSDAPAQDVGSASSRLQATSHLVLIPGIVRSLAGAFVSGLGPDDFVILDNGKQQTPIHVDQPNNQPLAVVLVMQTGAAAYQNFKRYETVTKLLRLAPVLKVALVTFDSKPEQIWPFPIHSNPIFRAIDDPHSGDTGAAILDAVDTAVDLLQGEPPEERRLIILLSQRGDMGSKVVPLHFLQRLGQSNAPVYSFSFPSQGRTQENDAERGCLAKGSTTVQEAIVGSLMMEQIRKRLCQDTAAELATVSGGESLLVKRTWKGLFHC